MANRWTRRICGRPPVRWFAVVLLVAALSGGCNGGESESVCGPDTVECDGRCVDIERDRDNCAVCGHQCGDHEVCVDARCVVNCPEGQTRCGERCVNLEVARDHCGACGLECPTDELCSGGVCQPSCGEELMQCGDECRDLQSDLRHCGECNNSCSNGEICEGGTCQPSCPDGYVDCGSGCVNPDTTQSHCGACGQSCLNGKVCSDGECVPNCPPELTECAGGCVDVDHNSNHCGGCDESCGAETGATAACVEGECSFVCEVGAANCNGDVDDGCEVDLMGDNQHCGSCGHSCAQGKACIDGICEPAPPVQVQARGGDGEAYVWWGYSADASEYSVYRCSTPTFCGDDPVTELQQLSWLDDTGLTNGETYYYWVSSSTDSGESARSGPAEVVPDATAGIDEFNCDTQADGVVLDWTVAQQGASPMFYRVYDSVGDPGPDPPTDQVAAVEPATATSLHYHPGVDGAVFYAVRGVRSAGPHQWDGPYSEIVGCTPTGPGIVKAHPEGDYLGVSWTTDSFPGVTGDDNYTVHWRPAGETTTPNSMGVTCPATLKWCHVTLDEVSPEQEYELWVTANNEVGTSSSPPDGTTPLVASSQPIEGILDLTFGLNGWVPFSLPYSDYGAVARMYTDADGSMVAAIWDSGADAALLARYLSGGSLDESFGEDGYSTIGSGSPLHRIRVLEKDSQDRIWVAGGIGEDALIHVVDDSGQPVESFGDEGSIAESFTEEHDRIRALESYSDGSVVVAADSQHYTDVGWVTLARFDANGELDFLFGDNGTTELYFDDREVEVADLVEQDDGKIIVYGEVIDGATSDGVMLFRFHPDGTLDTSFGDGGMVYDSLTAHNQQAHQIEVASDGDYIVDGYSRWEVGGEHAIMPFTARYEPSGELDAQYGDSGVDTWEEFTEFDYPQGVRMQRSPDGRMLFFAGVSSPNGHPAGIVVRYDADGTLDEGFGEGGYYLYEHYTSEIEFTRGVVQPSGRIVAVGYDWQNSDHILLRIR